MVIRVFLAEKEYRDQWDEYGNLFFYAVGNVSRKMKSGFRVAMYLLRRQKVLLII